MRVDRAKGPVGESRDEGAGERRSRQEAIEAGDAGGTVVQGGGKGGEEDGPLWGRKGSI